MGQFLYIAAAFGALALYLMMPRRGYCPRKLGALLGAITLGALWLHLARRYLPPPAARGLPAPAMAYYYLFSALAIGSAVRVLTHTKPVYAALWFVIVVLSSAGLFVILSAEFMAFAMVIIYAGAILVTYVFVIMLATRSVDPSGPDEGPDHDRVAREPAGAVCVGFLLLAALVSATLAEPSGRVAPLVARHPDAPDRQVIRDDLSRRPVRTVLAAVDPAHRQALADALLPEDRLANAERVGLDLFRAHPLGLELAGVILAVALVGAVVFAGTGVDPHRGPDPPAPGD